MNAERLIIKPKRYREATGVVSARLPGDMIGKLDRIAEDTGYNRNELIQLCLEFAIDHMEYREQDGTDVSGKEIEHDDRKDG